MPCHKEDLKFIEISSVDLLLVFAVRLLLNQIQEILGILMRFYILIKDK